MARVEGIEKDRAREEKWKVIPTLMMVIIALCIWLNRVYEKKATFEKQLIALQAVAEGDWQCAFDATTRELLLMTMDRDIYKGMLDSRIKDDVELFDATNKEIRELKSIIRELERFIADEGIEIEWIELAAEQDLQFTDVKKQFIKK